MSTHEYLATCCPISTPNRLIVSEYEVLKVTCFGNTLWESSRVVKTVIFTLEITLFSPDFVKVCFQRGPHTGGIIGLFFNIFV